MVRVFFVFLTCFHVNVARSNSNPTWHTFQSYGVMLPFATEAKSSLMTKTLICRRIIKNNALLEKFRYLILLGKSLFTLFA